MKKENYLYFDHLFGCLLAVMYMYIYVLMLIISVCLHLSIFYLFSLYSDYPWCIGECWVLLKRWMNCFIFCKYYHCFLRKWMDMLSEMDAFLKRCWHNVCITFPSQLNKIWKWYIYLLKILLGSASGCCYCHSLLLWMRCSHSVLIRFAANECDTR